MSWTIVTVVTALFAIVALVWFSERHRRRVKSARFDDREPLEVEYMVRTSFPESKDFDSLVYWWRHAAATLRIDARLIRVEDRFDGALGPVPGYPTADEIEELGAMVQEIVPDCSKRLNGRTLDTFGQYVRFLAENAPASATARPGL
jgi:hypothetical protein